MLKKMIVVAVVGGLAVAAFKGTKMASYVRTEVQSIRDAAEDAVPPEKEIARLRNEVKLLDEDAFKVVKHLARLQSDQADLQKRIKTLEENKSAKAEVLKARETAVREAEGKVKTGDAKIVVTIGDQRFSLDVAKSKLKETVRDYTDLTKALERDRAKLDSQQRIIDKLEKQRMAMTRLKGDLDGAIDELETDLQSVKLQQMESKYQTDDTRVAQIKESIAKQRKRLDVQRRELAMLQETEAPTLGGSESVDEIMAPITGAKPAPAATLPKSGD